MDRLSCKHKIKKRIVFSILAMELFLSPVFAAFATDSISNELSSSPDDVTQLLSTLEKENNSLIPKTPFNSLVKKIEQEKKWQKEKYGVNWGMWHVPDQPEKQQLSDQGISVVLQKNLFNKLIPFVKLDWSKGRVATFNKLFITGFGLQHPFYGSIGLWGLGMGYAQLAEDATNQAILESFYRIQLTPNSQLTPNIQFIKTLPMNGHQPIATVWNLRYRVAL